VNGYRSPYDDMAAEDRADAMADELAHIEQRLQREYAELDARRGNVHDQPRRVVGRVRIQEAKIAELEKRSNELHQLLHPPLIGGRVEAPSGYVYCRASRCGRPTGREATFERAGLCESCWSNATPSREGNAP
jgi:hypothetical protein